jgi:hypothetical protein
MGLLYLNIPFVHIPRAETAQSVNGLGYGRDDTGTLARFPAGVTDLSGFQSVQTGYGAHHGFFPGGKGTDECR